MRVDDANKSSHSVVTAANTVKYLASAAVTPALAAIAWVRRHRGRRAHSTSCTRRKLAKRGSPVELRSR